MIRWLLGCIGIAAIIWLTITYVRVGRAAGGTPLAQSDAIVVFGAAEYAGKPSPIFRSRLDHALELWQQHWAPRIITTGGHAADVQFSEGDVGERYLISRGVPESAIIAETQASDTAESARRVSRIMRANGMQTCIAVSDGYHLFRIEQMMQREGIAVRGAPRRELHAVSGGHRFYTKLRESLSYTFWQLHLS
ncbi:MAG: YdcF family protein [Acidobacteriales bacterium]|nr:YdcF family protein [Terriglobales bacterium]